ncbi:MAG: hypothetical protein LGR52_11330 [Candidatus Thiosymbion ectosymbiont of Robbea hypermnestra]|nr:hypothetical protein [Candidatus Thiosymbion ectosymbiont of Robbea hypermnestra]
MIRCAEQAGKSRAFDNTPRGHAAVVNALRTAQVRRVCLEATDLYHLNLALASVGADSDAPAS